MASTAVDFWFDPVCPWAWLTSRWLIEAAIARDLDVRWHLMSLYFLNAEREMSADHRAGHFTGLRALRVIAAARAEHGDEAVPRLYTAFGEAWHVRREARDDSTLSRMLEAATLPGTLARAADDGQWDDVVRAEHDDGVGRVGSDVGTPIISVGGRAIFGPVVTPAPRGEAAGRLWDGVALVLSTDGFFELKRGRDRAPIFS
ncbi:MAG: DsbA family protein [Mycobacteriales bacterium]|nr:DsbA family protein [Frankia sp.]